MNTGIIVGGAILGTIVVAGLVYLAVKPSDPPAAPPQQFSPYPTQQPVVQRSEAADIVGSVAQLGGAALNAFVGNRADRDRAAQAQADREAAAQERRELMVFCASNPTSGLCTAHPSATGGSNPATSAN